MEYTTLGQAIIEKQDWEGRNCVGKNWEGHGFSRAVKAANDKGFSP
jgi:hypothetical protein